MCSGHGEVTLRGETEERDVAFEVDIRVLIGHVRVKWARRTSLPTASPARTPPLPGLVRERLAADAEANRSSLRERLARLLRRGTGE